MIGINARVIDLTAVGGHGEATSLAIPIAKVHECFVNDLDR